MRQRGTVMMYDAFGLPIHFEITGGHVHDCKIAPQLVTKLKDVEYIVGDRGYDSEPLRTQIVAQGASAVIPRKNNSKVGNNDIDWCLYKYRHLVDRKSTRLNSSHRL